MGHGGGPEGAELSAENGSMFFLLAAAHTSKLFLGDGDATDTTGTHPNDVFGGAYDFCAAKFGSEKANIEKCAVMLTVGAHHVCKGVEDRFGECHVPVAGSLKDTNAYPG